MNSGLYFTRRGRTTTQIAIALLTISILTGCNRGNPGSTEPEIVLKEANSSSGGSVQFASGDGLSIAGKFYAATAQNRAPAVLMLHQWMGAKEDFDSLASEFQKQGIAVLAIDGRGFGGSTKKGTETVKPGRTDDDVKGMLMDVSAAVSYLRHHDGIDPERIGILGASYGSSLAIIYAAGDKQVRAVALVSPGLNYFGNLQTQPAVKAYGDRPLFITAAEDDPDSAASSRTLDSMAEGTKHILKVFPDGGHGRNLLNAGKGLDKDLLVFFSGAFLK